MAKTGLQRIKRWYLLIGALIAVPQWLLKIISLAGDIDWTLQSGSKFAVVWNFATSNSGVIIVGVGLFLGFVVIYLLSRRVYELDRIPTKGENKDESKIDLRPHPQIIISPTISPTFNNSPQVDQRALADLTHPEDQRPSRAASPVPPSIEPLPTKIRELFVTPFGEVTDESETFDAANLKMPIAIAEFYRRADRYTEAFVEARARITFFENDVERHRIDNGYWFQSERHHVKFQPGDTRKLIIGIIHEGVVLPYEGKFKPIEATFETDEKYFVLANNRLEGSRFRVLIELIAINPQRVAVLDKTIEYDLELDPVTFTLRQ